MADTRGKKRKADNTDEFFLIRAKGQSLKVPKGVGVNDTEGSEGRDSPCTPISPISLDPTVSPGPSFNSSVDMGSEVTMDTHPPTFDSSNVMGSEVTMNAHPSLNDPHPEPAEPVVESFDSSNVMSSEVTTCMNTCPPSFNSSNVMGSEVVLEDTHPSLNDPHPDPVEPVVEYSLEEPAPTLVLPEITPTTHSLEEPAPTLVLPELTPTTYEVVEEGSRRGKAKLVDSSGFSFNVRSKRNYATYWQCTVRPKKNACKASVIERAGTFTPGQSSHNHAPQAGAATAARIVAAIKSKAVADISKPVGAIMNEVLLHEFPTDTPRLDQRETKLIARAANRLRQKLWPKDPPVDMNFPPAEDTVPAYFYRAEVKVKRRRHWIFATDDQLNQLAVARSWYIDETLKLIAHPFKQIMSISAFVRSGELAKQVPLCFVLMSERKKSDYKKVLREIIRILPGETLNVQHVTADFEPALWSALKTALDHAQLQGCAFHWKQAVWRKAQELGLQAAYCQDDPTYRYIRKLLALPLLPHMEITPQFKKLRNQAESEPLKALVSYVDSRWISNGMFPTKDWSVYRQAVRTIEDVEGWHDVLNQQASGCDSLSFSFLIQLLHQEALLVNVEMKLVADQKLARIQRRKYGQFQSRIHEEWNKYDERQKTIAQLLKACSKLNGPAHVQ